MITPWPARLQAAVAGLMPGLTSDIAGRINQWLPGPGGIGRGWATGRASRSTMEPKFARQRVETAARANNEV